MRQGLTENCREWMQGSVFLLLPTFMSVTNKCGSRAMPPAGSLEKVRWGYASGKQSWKSKVGHCTCDYLSEKERGQTCRQANVEACVASCAV